MKQLFQLLVKNNLLQGTVSSNTCENKDYNLTCCDTKRGREIRHTASKGLLASERYDLGYSILLQYLKLLRRISDDYS